MEYIGETDAKRLARWQLYNRVNALQPAGVRKDSVAVVLAGPEAGEIGTLRHLLKYTPQQVLFVDVDKTGLEVAKRRWRGVRTYHGDVVDALRQLEQPISFLNLDFMGQVNEARVEAFRAAAPWLVPGAVVSYTFFRGREMPGQGIWNDVLRVPVTREDRPLQLDEQRFVGYSQKILSALPGDCWVPVFMLRYTALHELVGRQAPMGVLAFQHAPPVIRTAAWRKALADKSYEGAAGTALDSSKLRPQLYSAELDMRRAGNSKAYVNAVLNY